MKPADPAPSVATPGTPEECLCAFLNIECPIHDRNPQGREATPGTREETPRAPLNLNEYVWVRLTEYGNEIEREYWKGHDYLPPQPLNWRKFQLWHVMEMFGPYLHLASRDVFNPLEIRFSGPAAIQLSDAQQGRKMEDSDVKRKS